MNNYNGDRRGGFNHGSQQRGGSDSLARLPEIKFYLKDEEKIINAALFNETAQQVANCFGAGNKNHDKDTQIRKFYDEVVRCQMESKTKNWEAVLPMLNLLVAKTAYAVGRGNVSENFYNFIKTCVSNVRDKQDLDIFKNFFEAVIGFRKMALEK